jgi:hypothetical protein
MTLDRLAKMPTTAVRRLISFVEPLEWIGRADLATMGLRELEVGKEVGLGIGEKLRDRRKALRGCR